MKQLFFRLKRALTIEYAIIMMTLVAAFAAMILTVAGSTSVSAVDYRDYTERKAYLDEVGQAFIENTLEGGSNDLHAIEGNEWGYYIQSDSTELRVFRGDASTLNNVDLYVRVEGGALVAYVYGTL